MSTRLLRAVMAAGLAATFVLAGAGAALAAAPIASDDEATVSQDSSANPIDVLSNDTDPDGPTGLTIVGNTDPPNGTGSCTTSSCSYTPDPGFSGADSFTYTISDGSTTDSATVNITVTPAGLTHIGQTFPGGTTSVCEAGTAAVQVATHDPPGYTAPTSGVLTSWSHLAGNDTGRIQVAKLKVFRPVAPNTYLTVGSSSPVTLVAGSLNTFALSPSIPVQAGDVLGLAAVTAIQWCAFPAASPPPPGDVIGVTGGDPTVGATSSFAPESGLRLNVAATHITPGSLQFSAPTYSVGEAGLQATITVTRTGGSDGTVTVDYTTSDGSASGAGVDYTTTSGALNFANGDTSETFTIPITNDPDDEPDETVNLALSNPTGGATLGSPSTAVLTITDDDEPATGCTILGTPGNDNLVGTNGDDVICAGPGDDTISGRRGNDTILGEDGNDLAQPGGGNDTFDGGNGTDEINYNEAAPTGGATIHLGTQTATAPGAGSDTLVSVENATGSQFDDSITGSAGPNVIVGRQGNDTVNAKGGNDTIDGKAGNDTLGGENGDDTITGGTGDDSINGNAGADTLNGVDGVSGNDTVDGGSDFDVDSCSADPGDTVVNCP